MTDLTINENSSVKDVDEQSWAEGGGGASVSLFGIVELGGGGSAQSYSGSSTRDVSRNISQHAESASSYVAAGVRAQRATSVGEVETRVHKEGETEDHFESASRMFENPNKCHAITYNFWNINKTQVVKWRLVAVRRYIEDPIAPAGINQRPNLATGVAVRPQAVLANDPKRLTVEENARKSLAAKQGRDQEPIRTDAVQFDDKTRILALGIVKRDLVANGILKPGGRIDADIPSDEIIAELSWERVETLPTAGLQVKGCLDECSVCEEALEEDMKLDLEYKALRNKKLAREIELLDQAAEYHCCGDNPMHCCTCTHGDGHCGKCHCCEEPSESSEESIESDTDEPSES